MSPDQIAVVVVNFITNILFQFILYKIVINKFEKFKGEIKYETTKKEFTFTKLHELKVKEIQFVFSDLIDFEENLDDILVYLRKLKDNDIQLNSIQIDSLNNYNKNKFILSSKKSELFLNEEICEMLHKFRGRIYNTIREVESIKAIISSSEINDLEKERMLTETKENLMLVFDEIPELKQKLKKLFIESLKSEF